MDVPAFVVELTLAREAIAAVEAAHAAEVLAIETSAQEAVVALDNTTLHVKDIQDRASLAGREVLEWVSQEKAKNTTVLASAREDAEGHDQKVTLLEYELAVERWAREMSEREHRAHIKEFTLLQTRGSKLCHAIIGPPRAKHHLSMLMRLAALHQSKMAGELTAFWMAVSSTTESMLGHSPSDTTNVDVVGELVAKFQEVEGQHS
jgi:hypothetical protein